MKHEMKSRLPGGLAVATLVIASAVAPAARAAGDEWRFEITPYLWAVGIDGDVTVGGQTVAVDKSFSDLFDAVDFGAAALLVGQLHRFVFLAQLDFYSMSTDELDDPPARGALDTDTFMGTLAAGYQLGDREDGHALDVLLGVRTLSLENELRLNGIGRWQRQDDVTDPVIILRPDWRISDRWRFNPTFAYSSGGDSDESYELQPQLQFQISERIAMRFGYRRLHYDIDNGRNNRWNGAFQGIIVGVGGTFGSD